MNETPEKDDSPFLFFPRMIKLSIFDWSTHACKKSRGSHLKLTMVLITMILASCFILSMAGYLISGKIGFMIPVVFFSIKAIYELNHALSCTKEGIFTVSSKSTREEGDVDAVSDEEAAETEETAEKRQEETL